MHSLSTDPRLCLRSLGQGYTDTPVGVPHDARLFGTQIFYAVASSPLTWIGADSGGFSIIAFSLGGGIAMSFASYFPQLVKSIVLLTPGGLLRHLPAGYETLSFRYPHLVPFSYLRRLVSKILEVKLTRVTPSPMTSDNATQISSLDLAAIRQWQFENHKGFVYSFINTTAYGPIMHQQADWEKTCNIIKGKTSEIDDTSRSSHLFNSKLLVITGDSDDLVIGKDLSADLSDIFGDPEHVSFKVVPGGHDFPVLSSSDVVEHVSQFWGLPIHA